MLKPKFCFLLLPISSISRSLFTLSELPKKLNTKRGYGYAKAWRSLKIHVVLLQKTPSIHFEHVQ